MAGKIYGLFKLNLLKMIILSITAFLFLHTGTQTDLGPDLENAPKSQGAEEDIIFTNQINPGARAQAVQRQEALPQGGEQRGELKF